MEDNTEAIVSYLKKSGVEVVFSKEKIVINKGKNVTIDFQNHELVVIKKFPWKSNKKYPFSILRGIEVESDEQFADATPFQDGYREYYHSVNFKLVSGKTVNVFTIVDRNKEGHELLGEFVQLLRGQIN